VMVLLVPPSRRRSAFRVLGIVAVFYALLRFMVLQGAGGYLDASGVSTLWSPEVGRFARTAGLLFPYLVLVPIKNPDPFTIPLAGSSLCLMTGFLVWGSGPLVLRRLLLAGGALALALVPTMPVLGIMSDHSGARFFYWPVCAALLALGRDATTQRRSLLCGLVLVACWGAAATRNARAWTEAKDEVGRTLSAMQMAQSRFPGGARVLVDAPDMIDGAYVFRNGLSEAARLAGLREDLIWRRGTAASSGVDAAERLGRDVFVIGSDRLGRPVDWTRCERDLMEAASPAIRTWSAEDMRRSFEIHRRKGGVVSIVSPAFSLPADSASVHMRLAFSPCSLDRFVSGVVLWRTNPSRPLGFTESRVFRAEKDGRVAVRLGPASHSATLSVRIVLEEPLPLECWQTLSVCLSPGACEL